MTPKLIEVVRQLKRLDTKSQIALKLYPLSLEYFIIDNEYITPIQTANSLLLTSLFGDASSDVEWGLYEFNDISPSKGPHIITTDKKEYIFKNFEDFLEYLRIEC
jgi:hypothetical protein